MYLEYLYDIQLYVLGKYLDYIEVEVELMLELVYLSYMKEEIKNISNRYSLFDMEIWLNITAFSFSNYCL
jgi:hypothetical protein